GAAALLLTPIESRTRSSTPTPNPAEQMVEAAPSAAASPPSEPEPERVDLRHMLVVDDATGAPIADAAVYVGVGGPVRDLPRTGVPASRTDAAGRASAPAGDGGRPPTVTVQADGFGPRKAIVSASDPRAPQQVRLFRGARMVGTAVGAGDGSTVWAVVREYELYEPTHESLPFLADARFHAPVRGDGSFALDALPPNVRLDVRLVAASPVRDVRTLPEPVRLEPGESREVHFSPVAAPRIIGRALFEDGTPARRVKIHLVPSSIGRVGLMETYWEAVARATADDDGRFVFEGVEAGRWIVGPDARQRGLRDDERYAPIAVAVDVEEGAGDATVEIRLHRGLFISGIVLGPDGRPKRAHVGASRATSFGTVQGSSGEDGIFRLGPLLPGPVSVTAHPKRQGEGPVLSADSDPVEAEPGDEDLELRLNGGGAFTVRAVEPGTGATVDAGFVVGAGHSVRLDLGFKGARTYDRLPEGEYSVHATTRDGRAGHLSGLFVRGGEHRSDIRIEVEPAGALRVRNGANDGVLGVSVLRDADTLASDGVRPGNDFSATLVPGRVELRLVLRDWSGARPVEVRRETRTLDIVAGETTEVVFGE
ncbi:MAG: hypothetical protein AAGB93_00470, partial [Planctomycetota bacterium]